MNNFNTAQNQTRKQKNLSKRITNKPQITNQMFLQRLPKYPLSGADKSKLPKRPKTIRFKHNRFINPLQKYRYFQPKSSSSIYTHTRYGRWKQSYNSNCSQNASPAIFFFNQPNFFPSTLKRYVSTNWKVYLRLQVERYLTQKVSRSNRVYFTIVNVIKLLKSSPEITDIVNSTHFTDITIKNLDLYRPAKKWHWSLYQIRVFSLSIFLIFTIPEASSLALIIFKYLLRSNRKHAAAVKFFTAQINKAIAKYEDVGSSLLYNPFISYRLQLSGRVGGGLRKKKLLYLSPRPLYVYKSYTPVHITSTYVCTEFGTIGIKFWLQVFPKTEHFTDLVYEANHKV